MATVPKRLRELLDHYRLRWRVVQATAGLLMTLCAIVGGAGLGVLVDRLTLGAPQGVRWALLAVIALAAAALLLRRVLVPVSKRMGDERTAARLGKNFPTLAEDLVTGVELSRDQDSYGVSKDLVEAALSQIDRRSETVSWRQAVPLGQLARSAAVFAVLALAMALAYLFAPEAVSNSVGRLIRPSRTDFFSYTKLNVEPGDQVVRKGDPVEVRFSVSGHPVKRAILEVRAAGGDAFSSEVVVVAGVGAWKSAPLVDNLRYRVKAGDNVSPWYGVRTLPPPSLISKSVRVTPPAYTERPETTVENVVGTVTVVNGPERDHVPQPSKVVIQVKPANRGDDPKFACNAWLTAGAETYAMKAEGGLLVSPQLTPTETADYTITLKDGFGLTNRAPETISIAVVPDTKPSVTIPKPGSDLSQLPGAAVPITASATDDYGVRDLKLQTRLVHDKAPADEAPEDWKTVPLATGGPTQERVEGNTELMLSDFNPVPGDHIDIRAAASDYADEAMFRNAYSEVYRITVISNADHLDIMLDRLMQIADKVDLASRKQAAEAKQTGEMKNEAAKDNKAAEAANAEQREQELRDKVKELQSEVAEVVADLSDNPMTPASLLSDLSKAEAGMESAESKPMKQAAEQLSKAAQNKSAKPPDSQQQQDLQEAQKAQKAAADELQKLSSEISRIQRRKLLEILADEAERLSHEQAEARVMTGKTATEIGGRTASELQQADLDKVVRVAGLQKLISAGIGTLGKDIEKVLENLTQENGSEAGKASDALNMMQDDRLTQTSEEVASQISENNLFAQTPRQQALSDSLMEVASTLRTSDDMNEAAKELQEFIKRQKELNGRMEKLIGGDVKAADPDELAPKPPANPSGAMIPNPPRAVAAIVSAPVRIQAIRRPAAQMAMARVSARAQRVSLDLSAAPIVVAQNSAPAPAPAPAAAPVVPTQVKIVGVRLGEHQGLLGQDVSEHSLAMRDLFKELGLFQIETADKLDQASAEMGLAAQDLPVPSLPQALDHGKKALELLEEAAKSLPEDQQEMDEQEKDAQQMSLEEMMELAKIIGQEKALHADTATADRVRTQTPAAFPERVMALSRRQGRIRYDTTKLSRKLQAERPNTARLVDLAGGKMDASHTALESGDAGQETRKAQTEAVQLLETLLKEQQQQQNEANRSAAAMMAMQAIQNLSQARHGGGFHNRGTNGPVEPARLEATGYRVSTQQKYDEKMSAGFEAEFPPEFRGLLNSYFDQVRKETRP
jgi:hypothetical protein